MPSLVNLLYLVSSSLLVPVIGLLLVFVLATLLECGGFLREWKSRKRNGTRARDPRDSAADSLANPDALPGLVGAFVRRAQKHIGQPVALDDAMANIEVDASRRLARMSLFLRVGPMLGLMGTLIPLGPALIGLSSGNLDALAEDLVVAFSTTVLGLLVGGLCYAMWLTRRQWYAQDMVDIEFIKHCLAESSHESSQTEYSDDERA